MGLLMDSRGGEIISPKKSDHGWMLLGSRREDREDEEAVDGDECILGRPKKWRRSEKAK